MKISEELAGKIRLMVESFGLEFVAIETTPRVLRVVVDAIGGVTLDDCTRVSRELSALLDVEDPIPHSYNLEVTSPGLERKFYSAEDYHRFAGKRVRVKMKPGWEGERVLEGKLVGLKEGKITLVLLRGEEVELPYDEVMETRLSVNWDELLKEGKCRL